jgi:RNA polymerase sigma factor (sigma-70 family)
VPDEDGGAALESRLPISRHVMRDDMCRDCGAVCEAGIDALYRAYSGQLLRFVRQCAAERRLPESQLDAEGVVQETFEQLLRDPGAISHPLPWLYTVARRHVARIHGGQRRHAHRDPGRLVDGASTDARWNSLSPPVGWTSLAPRALLEDVIAARAVMDAIADLPDRQRAATYLRQVEGWSLKEIGSYLSCAAATAGVHVHRGTRAIAERQQSADLRGPLPAQPTPAPAHAGDWPMAVAALLLTGMGAGLLYRSGAPLWVVVGPLAIVLAAVTGACLCFWLEDRRLTRLVNPARQRRGSATRCWSSARSDPPRQSQ